MVVTRTVVILLIISSASAKSYNQPKLSLCASWNPNATTLANESLIGQQPTGIHIDAENTVYVANRQNGRVLVWHNESSTPTGYISGNLVDPWSLFVTTNGDLYVDNGVYHNRIDRWIFNATNIMSVMNVHHSCTGLFVIDITLYCSSANEHRVVKIELNNVIMIPVTIAGTGCPGPVSNMLDHPHGIFFDSSLHLYVADTDNNRIQRFAPGHSEGMTVAGFGSTIDFILNKPTSLILDTDGYLFIVESYNHRIIRSIPNGFQCVVGCKGERGTKPSQLDNPQTLAFDSIGNIFVTDMNNHRIQKFILTTNTCEKDDVTKTRTTTTTHLTTKLVVTTTSECNVSHTTTSTEKSVTYSQAFVHGVTPSLQCCAWLIFQSQLVGTYSTLTIKGTNDAVGIVLTNPTYVNGIAYALLTNSVYSPVSSNGYSWGVGGCVGGSELTATRTVCQCNSGYTVRPCIGNYQWGGIGSTCSSASQTLTVVFQ